MFGTLRNLAFYTSPGWLLGLLCAEGARLEKFSGRRGPNKKGKCEVSPAAFAHDVNGDRRRQVKSTTVEQIIGSKSWPVAGADQN